MHAAARMLALTTLLASVAPESSLVRAGETADPKAVFIEVQADGASCIVRTIKFPCQDVLVHLRSDLQLPAGTWVRFKADRSAPYQSVKAVIDAVQNSEYTTSAAYVRPRVPNK